MAKELFDGKTRIEDEYRPSQKELGVVGDVYSDFYNFRNYRSGQIRQFKYLSFDDYIRQSRELFWNSIAQIESEDLENLDLNLSFPFIRKEVMEFLSRLIALNIKPKIIGDDLNSLGIKILGGLYNRWRFKSNDKVEKFWQSLYGVINGTACIYVGFNSEEKMERFLTMYNPETGEFKVDEKAKKYWNDVETTIIPIEDIYLKKIYERNIQKQGKVIVRKQMDLADFQREFKQYPDAKYVLPGNMISSDSLYFQLLGGTGVITTDKVDVLKEYNTDDDEYIIVANGIWLNKLGRGENQTVMPMPFTHKIMPFVWSINEAIDEKFAYGLSMPFKIKDPHKMLNASYIMLMERELRAINTPILSSDLESPEIVNRTGKVIPVGDVSAYKELTMSEASQAYFTSMNSIQSIMSSQAQGGSSQIIPSVQPKSAKEISQMDLLRQQAMGSALLMYYDMLRQEILLILKTMLQFYSNLKYSAEKGSILKTMNVPNMPLTEGGIGNLELRIVKETTDPVQLHFDAVRKSIENGKKTEIIEAPIEFIQNIEFMIQAIELESEKTSDVEKAMWMETLTGLMNMFGQTGLIDPSKALLRTLEKMQTHPSDIVSDQAIPGMMSYAKNAQYVVPGLNRATQMGAAAQSAVGEAFGAQSNGGQGIIPNE